MPNIREEVGRRRRVELGMRILARPEQSGSNRIDREASCGQIVVGDIFARGGVYELRVPCRCGSGAVTGTIEARWAQLPKISGALSVSKDLVRVGCLRKIKTLRLVVGKEEQLIL